MLNKARGLSARSAERGGVFEVLVSNPHEYELAPEHRSKAENHQDTERHVTLTAAAHSASIFQVKHIQPSKHCRNHQSLKLS